MQDIGRTNACIFSITCGAAPGKAHVAGNKKAADTGVGALRPEAALQVSYRTMGAPLPRMARPSPMGRIKTVTFNIDTVALSFHSANMSRLPACSSQESVSQAGWKCQEGAATNLRNW
jgi:hypothetical protein